MKIRPPFCLPLLLAAFVPALFAADSTAPKASAPPADPSTAWDLTPLYRDEAGWRAAKEQVTASLPKIATLAGHLGDSAANLRTALDLIFDLRKQLGRLDVYASLSSDENTRDSAALERTQEINLVETDFSRATSFLNPEILAVGDAKIRAFSTPTRGSRNTGSR
jgi:oligoendopeptidase F